MTEPFLTDEQVAAFERDGFLVVDGLTDPDEVAALRDAYDELFARAGGFEGRDRIELAVDGDRPVLPQVLNPERYLPELLQGRAFANACRLAVQLLGDDGVPEFNHAINKPPRDGAPTPWHQDEAYWDPRADHTAISVWVPLQDVDESNGCMAFVPGSHRQPVLPHRLIHPDAHGLRLADDTEPAGAVVCPIPAGSATVHAGRTLHYAGPNRTDRPRRAVAFAFACPPVPRATPHHYPWQRPEWFDDAHDPRPDDDRKGPR